MSLDAVLPDLACPVCGATLTRDDRRIVCREGHSFDMARQGYVTLTAGARAGTADTAAMVTARDRFLGAGHYRPLAGAIADLARRHAAPGLVLDLAGGTGYYLAGVLDALPDRVGACFDLSAAALRRAARAHPRAAAVGADVWRRLPLLDARAGLVLNVFGPRDVGELRRVLAPGGVLVTASPAREHLHELVGPLRLLGVDPLKAQRRAAAFGGLELVEQATWTATMSLDPDAVAALAGMGPSGAHLSAAEIAERVAELAAPVAVTATVELEVYTH